MHIFAAISKRSDTKMLHSLFAPGWHCISFKLQWLHCWGLSMDKSFHPLLYSYGYNYLSMLVLKLTHVGKRGPGHQLGRHINVTTSCGLSNKPTISKLRGSRYCRETLSSVFLHFSCPHADVSKWKHFFCVTGSLCGESTGHRWVPP